MHCALRGASFQRCRTISSCSRAQPRWRRPTALRSRPARAAMRSCRAPARRWRAVPRETSTAGALGDGPSSCAAPGTMAGMASSPRSFSSRGVIGWSVALIGSQEALRGDAATARAAFTGAVMDPSELVLEGEPTIIDALYGAGLSRPIEGEAAAAHRAGERAAAQRRLHHRRRLAVRRQRRERGRSGRGDHAPTRR